MSPAMSPALAPEISLGTRYRLSRLLCLQRKSRTVYGHLTGCSGCIYTQLRQMVSDGSVSNHHEGKTTISPLAGLEVQGGA